MIFSDLLTWQFWVLKYIPLSQIVQLVIALFGAGVCMLGIVLRMSARYGKTMLIRLCVRAASGPVIGFGVSILVWSFFHFQNIPIANQLIWLLIATIGFGSIIVRRVIKIVREAPEKIIEKQKEELRARYLPR